MENDKNSGENPEKFAPPRRKIRIIAGNIVSCNINGEPEGGRQVTDYQEYEVTVASEKVPGVVTSCGNNILTDVYAVRYAREDDWKMLVSIEGFEYESGYEYILRISRTDYLDYSMGEPAWTEYALLEEISKEAKASENVPDNFIPEWFFEQHCADLDDFAYKVEAEDPAAVEDDIESDPAFSFNGGRCCIAGLGKWFLLDRDGNVGKLYEDALKTAAGRYFENEIYNVDETAVTIFDARFPPKEHLAGSPTQRRFAEILAMQKNCPFHPEI